jgi:hypothetical protein
MVMLDDEPLDASQLGCMASAARATTSGLARRVPRVG